MATTIINSHKVENFAKWKEGFEAESSMRKKLGITIKGVFQSVEDENQVTVISEMPSAEIAKAVLSDPEFKAAGQKSGIISAPEIKILNQII
ncbi:MAG: hypothetical protein EBS07_11495 [Sphingobacteriia bacterium]|nr:hypothetical protein [Sphingobacteriia bacterium]